MESHGIDAALKSRGGASMDMNIPDEPTQRHLNRVQQLFGRATVGIITAHRAEYRTRVDEQGCSNEERNNALRADIRDHGFGLFHIRGRCIDARGMPVEEHAFLMGNQDHKRSRRFLIDHGKKYGQDAVLFRRAKEPHAKLIGTKEGAFPGMDQEYDLGTFDGERLPDYIAMILYGGMLERPPTMAMVKFGVYNTISFFSRTETLFGD